MNFRITTVILSLLTILLSPACSNRASKLPDYGQVPAFTMVDSSGQPFSGDALAGKVWVADFIYTTCPAACPLMTSRMHSVEKKIHGESDVRLVSISVDPANDTPAAMARFARKYGGPTPQWIFLTGTPSTVHTLAYTTFHVGDIISKINHSTKFILVDKRGHIRGYYSTLGQYDDIPQMLEDLRALRSQSS